MQVSKGKLAGVRLLRPEAFHDHRGTYVETFNERGYRAAGVGAHFVQDDISTSKRGVLRGIHGDSITWKLVSCVRGRIFFVVVDCRPESPHFGAWEEHTLSARNHLQVLVPPGFGNGHLVLSKRASFHYKQSSYYPTPQFSYRWNDPRFAIRWPVEQPTLSERDRNAPLVGGSGTSTGAGPGKLQPPWAVGDAQQEIG